MVRRIDVGLSTCQANNDKVVQHV